MKPLFLIILLGCLSLGTVAQDTLNTDPIKKGYALLDKSREEMRKNPEVAMESVQEAIRIAIDQKDARLEAYSFSALGNLHLAYRNYPRSAESFNESIRLFGEIRDKKGLTQAQAGLATAYESWGQLDRAINAYSHLLVLATESDNKMEMSQAMIHLARINQVQKKLPIAMDWYKKALKIEEDRKNNKGIIEIRNYMGMLYQESGEIDKALECFGIASELARQSNNVEDLSQSYQSLSRFYQQQNDLIKEQEVLEEALKFNRELKRNDLIRNNLLRLGQIYLIQQEYNNAEEALTEANEISRKRKEAEKLKEGVNFLIQVLEKTGDSDRAMQKLKMLNSLNDSLMKTLNTENKINQQAFTIVSKYDDQIRELIESNRKKQDSLNTIKAEKELIELKLERQRQENRLRQTIIYGLVGMLAVISIATFLILRSHRERKQANRLLALQHLRAQMNPHFIFNSLNSINNFIARNDERSANKYLSEFSKLMRAVMENSKHPFVSIQSELDILKLYLDLEHLRFTDKFEYEFMFDPALRSEEIMVPPMLVQPYIENSIWHGLRYKDTKGKLLVQFIKNPDHILCVVQDDGIGRKKSAELKTKNQQSGESTAIRNIEHRLKIINQIHNLNLKVTIIDIENDDERGTRVEIMIPYITNQAIF